MKTHLQLTQFQFDDDSYAFIILWLLNLIVNNLRAIALHQEHTSDKLITIYKLYFGSFKCEGKFYCQTQTQRLCLEKIKQRALQVIIS